MKSNVSIGPASIFGWLAAIGLAAAALVEGDPTLAKYAAGVLALTNAGRQLQAAVRKVAPAASPLLPTDEEELASPPPEG